MLTRNEKGLFLGGVLLDELFGSGRVRTPAYVYDLDAIEAEARSLLSGFGDTPHLVAYAVKANTAGPVVRTLASAGCGAEVVSGAELEVALGAGIGPDKILYSGVGKRSEELDLAISAGGRGILAIQMESVSEIARVAARAREAGRRARISIRVNPGVEADTHAHVATGHDEAKFGIARGDLAAAYEAIERAGNLDLLGLGSHVGSQLTQTSEYLEAARILMPIVERARARFPSIELIDFGGGFGIDYGEGCPVRPADFAREAAALLAQSPLADLRLVVEPGRSLVAAHGVLCAEVISSKRSHFEGGERRWVMIDAGMNDLVRPAMYAARHRIEPMGQLPSKDALMWRVVGPVCESSDDFGEHPFDELPTRVVIRDAGAYGFVMASEYNGRPLPAEIFLREGRVVAVSESPGTQAWIARRLGIKEVSCF